MSVTQGRTDKKDNTTMHGVGRNGAPTTIDDIAEALGVSKTTVSRAISGKGRIGEETRTRVLEYIKESSYRPNLIAKGLAQNKTFNLGVVLPQDDDAVEMPFFQKCLMGICETAGYEDYDVVVITVREGDTTALSRVLENHKVDGIIVTRVLVKDELLEMLKNASVPYVVIGSFHDESIVQIDHDHRKAAEEMVSRLLQAGRERIALLGDNVNSVVNLNRYLGYVDALESAGVKDTGGLVRIVDSRHELPAAVNDLREKGADAVVCMDDFVCEGVLATLTGRAAKDFLVVSLYNSVHLARMAPPVPAVDYDVRGLGKVAAGTLLAMLGGKTPPAKQLLPYEVNL